MQDWGLEFNMALLLVAAFYYTNLFSLLYLAIIAVGMAAPVQARCLTWRFCVLPLLAAVLVEQYSLYIGLPPPWDSDRSGALCRHRSSTQHSPVKVTMRAAPPVPACPRFPPVPGMLCGYIMRWRHAKILKRHRLESRS